MSPREIELNDKYGRESDNNFFKLQTKQFAWWLSFRRIY